MSDLLILFRVRDPSDEPQTGTNIRVFSALLQDKSAVKRATVTAAFAANVLQLCRHAHARKFRTAAEQSLCRRASPMIARQRRPAEIDGTSAAQLTRTYLKIADRARSAINVG